MKGRFAYRIRQARRDSGLSQQEAAERIGVSAQYLCDIEHANRTPANWNLVENVSKVYGLNADLLWFDLGLLPPDVKWDNPDATPEQIVAAYAAMRAVLKAENT